MTPDQDQITALVVALLVLACGIGCCAHNVLGRASSHEVYELEEEIEA